jgi:hypothetical protein
MIPLPADFLGSTLFFTEGGKKQKKAANSDMRTTLFHGMVNG